MSEAHWAPEGTIEFARTPPHSPDHPVQPAEAIPADKPRPYPELIKWLQHSPNNPGYLQSDTYNQFDGWLQAHEHALHAMLTSEVAGLGFDHAEADVARILALRSSDGNMFTAYEAAYPKVTEAIVGEFRDTGVEDGRVTINNRAVRALGATMLQAEYIKRLAEKHPEIKIGVDEDGNNAASTGNEVVEMRPPFEAVFRQNVLAIIQRASWLDSLAQPSPEIPELHLVA